jgi:hypothetical protein
LGGIQVLKKTEKLVITFHTTTEAMSMESACKKEGADGRLIPVPRVISAGCGLAWCAELESEDALTALMQQYHIAPQGVYHCLV